MTQDREHSRHPQGSLMPVSVITYSLEIITILFLLLLHDLFIINYHLESNYNM